MKKYGQERYRWKNECKKGRQNKRIKEKEAGQKRRVVRMGRKKTRKGYKKKEKKRIWKEGDIKNGKTSLE